MRKLIVTGMPRSGTSWLGQIINSSPLVSFRTEPLFAYRFKNVINSASSAEEVNEFFERLVDVDDDFILQKDKLKDGYYPAFEKAAPTVLGFKTTRHFELLELYLSAVADLSVIAIVRHPCAVISSWFGSYREFEKKGCDQHRDWRSGGCRKSEVGEYWGFDDWLASTRLFLELARRYPNFHVVRYSDLVQSTETTSQTLFSHLGLAFTEQTRAFLDACHQRHDDDPYSVFKDKTVLNSWEAVLDPVIRDEILSSVNEDELKAFLS